jgi:hypothetical protein
MSVYLATYIVGFGLGVAIEVAWAPLDRWLGRHEGGEP